MLLTDVTGCACPPCSAGARERILLVGASPIVFARI